MLMKECQKTRVLPLCKPVNIVLTVAKEKQKNCFVIHLFIHY